MNSIQKWRQILQRCGIQIPYDKVEFNIKCPLHDDRVPSLSLNILKGVWFCHSGCGSGKLTDFVHRYYNLPLIQLSEGNGFNLDDVFNDSIKFEETLPSVKLPFKIGTYPPWIFERGFTKAALEKWGCGISAEQSLVIPIKDNQKRLVGWVCRRASGRTPKYVYSAGLEKSKVAFGLYNISKEAKFLCVTEGPLDTIWLDQWGFPSVALLGCNLSLHQQNLIDKFPIGEIILCLDNDMAGQTAAKESFKRLQKYHAVTQITLPTGIKDVQDIRDPAILATIIGERSVY